MAFKYDPNKATMTLPKGEYQAVLIDAEELDSKTGKPMQKITFRVYADNPTREILLTDYVVDPNNNNFAAYRYRKLAEAIGCEKDFKAGTFDAKDHMNAGLSLVIDTEESDKYGEQNRIKGFKPKAFSFKVPDPKAAKHDIKDSEIPF